MTDSPLVTIAIPTYNRLAFLRRTLQSAMAQSYGSIEIIVSDNSSNDGTAAYVSSITDARVQFIRQKTNLGMVGNWNACLEQARGDFFLLLSDDDYLEERAIEGLVEPFFASRQAKEVALTYCRTWEVDEYDRKRSIDPIPPKLEEAVEFALQYFRGNRKMHPSSTLFRTVDLKEIGGYTQGSLKYVVDSIAWSRILLQRGTIAGVPEPLANYRIHATRITKSCGIRAWQIETRSLIEFWAVAFGNSSIAVRRQFQRAAQHYESWEMAGVINAARQSLRARIEALGSYYQCRQSFAGFIGKVNLLTGLAKLFMPEALKWPIRRFLIRQQHVAARSCQ